MEQNIKILTIVVPCYNVGAYLEKNLNAYIRDDILSDIEILIINDGSCDNTQTIAETYVSRYPNTFILINKENGGHGSAVNCGIENATGKYFRIVDGDDWVNTDALYTMVNRLKLIETDLVLTNYQTVNILSGTTKIYRFDNIIYNKLYNISEMVYGKGMFPMTSVCYKTEILQKNNVALQEKTYYVDEEFNIIPFSYVTNLYYLDIVLYNYLIGNVNQSISIDNQIKRMDDKIKVAKRLIKFVNEENIQDVTLKYCNRKICGIVTSIYLISLVYDSNRGRGLQIAKSFHRYVKENNVVICKKSNNKYYVFRVLNILKISGETYEKFLSLFKHN